MKKQTAGRDSLGNFAPKFAELNDDVLFGEVWSREDKLSLRDRSLVTICIFMGKGLVDNSLKYHLINAKNNGITNFSIDNDGYLKIDNTENGLYSNELRNMQKSNKLYIINMTGIAYERDYISGEITEYPFEDMDPTQELESYKNDNAIIYVVGAGYEMV